MKCKITLGGDAMKIERDERNFDFHGIGLAIKKAREREGMTQEQLGYIVDQMCIRDRPWSLWPP